MPWYKFTAHSGAGHQSPHQKYEFFDEELSKEDKQFWWEDWMSGRDAIGEVVKVKKIPTDDAAELRQRYEKFVGHYRKLINEVNKAAEFPCKKF